MPCAGPASCLRGEVSPVGNPGGGVPPSLNHSAKLWTDDHAADLLGSNFDPISCFFIEKYVSSIYAEAPAFSTCPMASLYTFFGTPISVHGSLVGFAPDKADIMRP